MGQASRLFYAILVGMKFLLWPIAAIEKCKSDVRKKAVNILHGLPFSTLKRKNYSNYFRVLK
jgi:hypothetical protein